MMPKNPYRQIDVSVSAYRAWQEGFDAAIAHLFSPCTDHGIVKDVIEELGFPISTYKTVTTYYEHHYECPECMKELKEQT